MLKSSNTFERVPKTNLEPLHDCDAENNFIFVFEFYQNFARIFTFFDISSVWASILPIIIHASLSKSMEKILKCFGETLGRREVSVPK